MPGPRVMLERDVEEKICDYAKSRGIAAYKFTSPARRSVPDRLVLAPIPEWLRPVIAQYIQFIEMKRTGEDATPPQKREHVRLRALGFTVHVVDDPEKGKRIVDLML